jgi:signal transduction histidine kinase
MEQKGQQLVRDVKQIHASQAGIIRFGSNAGTTSLGLKMRMTTEELSPFEESSVPSETISYSEMHSLIKKSLEDLRAKLESQQTRVRVTFTSPSDFSMPVAVRASADTFSLCFEALLDHALESLGRAPGGMIGVTLRPTPIDVALSVENNGYGFSENLLMKFEDPTSQRGLGMRIPFSEVRKNIEKHGGTFELTARLGVGSRVTIQLPRADAMAPNSNIWKREVSFGDKIQNSSSGQTIPDRRP